MRLEPSYVCYECDGCHASRLEVQIDAPFAEIAELTSRGWSYSNVDGRHRCPRCS